MTAEANKALVRRMIEEVLVGGHLALMEEFVAPDFVNHNIVGTGEASGKVGVEPFRQEVIALRAAFPDLAVRIDELLCDGDKVIVRASAQGTHQGAFSGIPPTGRRVNGIASISIVRIANGKFAERWNLVDRFGMLQQLGVIPS